MSIRRGGLSLQILVSRTDPVGTRADALVVPMSAGDRVPRFARALNSALGGAIQAALDRGDFGGKSGESLPVPSDGVAATRVLLVGLGDDKKVDGEVLRGAVSRALRAARSKKAERLAVIAPPRRSPSGSDVGRALAEGAILGAYRFDKYRSAEEPPTEVKRLELLASSAAHATQLRAGVKIGTIVAESTNFARDLSNEPGSVHTPEWLAARARALGRDAGLKVRVFNERELEKRSMGGLLTVGRGAVNPPRMIILEHAPPARGGRKRPTIALVGKGITFDTGGVSLKPAASMEEMKHDMSGGAAVFGAMRAVALLRLPLHVVGVVPAAQNSPGGAAYLPGDIVRTASGKTIEVLNTDAEGRIVLADGLHHALSYDPAAIVDLATLTGACVVALGKKVAALLGNDEALQRKLRAASEATQERIWPLPLWEHYKEMVKSHIADIKNTGGREAGTITAAAFLSHFVGDTPWAHLDIAGNEATGSDGPYGVKGATGFGVRLLVDFLRNWR